MTMNRAGDCCQNKEVFFGTHAGYEKEKLFNLFKAIIDYYKKLLPNESFFKIVFKNLYLSYSMKSNCFIFIMGLKYT